MPTPVETADEMVGVQLTGAPQLTQPPFQVQDPILDEDRHHTERSPLIIDELFAPPVKPEAHTEGEFEERSASPLPSLDAMDGLGYR